jgi:hypothetical protein
MTHQSLPRDYGRAPPHSYQAKDRISNSSSRIRGIPPCGRISNIQGEGRKKEKGINPRPNIQYSTRNIQYPRGRQEKGRRNKSKTEYPIFNKEYPISKGGRKQGEGNEPADL